jgi:anion-transporting  ArsA/GET3 family ATPase
MPVPSPNSPPEPLASLIATRKVLVCVGAGGVGKTTLAAALGVAAARMGRRPLVLTVDPAKRLANALGLRAFDEVVQRIPVEAFAEQGCRVAQPLDAAMLDVKRTFDRVVTRYAPDPESRDRILHHPYYRQASTALAGSQEYMALERLYEAATSGDHDLVVLDTPPSAHALDFLDAPSRLVDLFDSNAFRLLLRPTSRLQRGMFRTGSVVMRGLTRFTGAEMFGNLLEFFGYLSSTFDGFVQRARDAQQLLQSPDTAFVLVSGCDDASTQQALYLRDRLDQSGMRVGSWIINRVAPFAPGPCQAGEELEAGLEALLQRLGSEVPVGDKRAAHRLAQRLGQVAREMGRLAEQDQSHVEQLRAQLGPSLPLVAVPRTADEPDSLARLCALAQIVQGEMQPDLEAVP